MRYELRLTLATMLALCLCVGVVCAVGISQETDEDGWVSLFSGEDLTGWKLVREDGRQSWSVVDGILTNVSTHEETGTDLMTERTFTDHELHLQFRVPQGGNSGVYLQGRYEVQVADSAGKENPGPGDCGGVWATSPPLKNAAKGVGEWQTYDIIFVAPRTDRDGNITENARVTVEFNGELIQDNVELPKPTGGHVDEEVTKPGVLMLQGNHSSIEYRDIRYRPLKIDWADEAEFTPLFDGESLEGWTVNGETPHGSGGKWEVAGGVITGTQDPPGNGGLLVTAERYGDFEIRCELNPDYGIDSGLFLRCQDDGQCYQSTVDYRDGGEVSTLYGEGAGGWLHQNPGWAHFYNHGEWNEIRAIIEGQPPRIQVWLNANQTVDFVDTEERMPAEGVIALQIHAGGDWGGKLTRFRNIRIRSID